MTSLNDPRNRYPKVEPPEQTQPHPGLDRDLEPQSDIGLETYQGNGRLKGRRALITGGDSGIGAAVAIAYAREGADVAIAYLPEEEPDAQRVIQAIEDAGQQALALPGDLCELEQCRKIVDETVEAFGGLDILVNNASRQIWHDGIENIPDDEFDKTMKSNIYSSYRVTKAAMAHLEPGSSIIFTSSIEAYQPTPTLLHYDMTKAAMNNLSKGLAQELAPKGIRVNAVAPGPIWTPLQPSHGQPQEQLTQFDEMAPLGRAGQPVELAGAYVFLASDEASYVMGETLAVTGGMLTP
ncbi:glucose 1-dehydrogenase [Corynebacterium halotolerans]|uniref:Dehydrogenase n=1 Tax=Corynebacterium halotolerans YIM 70093 = DSM 44683 TaxID=1121362 RepID=M1P9C6_9CORY|nr:glucose 1-dehydrogenase [Corynebacterium halotolerans]AGF73281.1 dehydrogenase [Corynebacterium halotolerans YIM 70093 = DSM 44683]